MMTKLWCSVISVYYLNNYVSNHVIDFNNIKF